LRTPSLAESPPSVCDSDRLVHPKLSKPAARGAPAGVVGTSSRTCLRSRQASRHQRGGREPRASSFRTGCTTTCCQSTAAAEGSFPSSNAPDTRSATGSSMVAIPCPNPSHARHWNGLPRRPRMTDASACGRYIACSASPAHILSTRRFRCAGRRRRRNHCGEHALRGARSPYVKTSPIQSNTSR
jgi:hypothetical protein